MKQAFRVLLPLCLALALAGCGAQPAAFDGSRVGDERQFRMEYGIFNGTESHAFTLADGDAIDIAVVSESGDLSVIIRRGEDAPVYEGHGLPTGSFRVTVHESGVYAITVTGKTAKGSARFDVVSAP